MISNTFLSKIVLGLALFLGLNGCLKEAEKDKVYPAKPIPIGVITGSAAYKTDYSQQSFYKLEVNKAISTNGFSEWDLAFDASADGWHIFLNSAKFMHLTNTGETDFDKIYSPKGRNFIFDASSGNLDSTAVGKWGDLQNPVLASFKQVYLLDMGITPQGKALGHKKIVFESVDANQYKIRYANLDGSEEGSGKILKDPTKVQVQFSILNGGKQINIQPNKADWDILFTQYSTKLFDGSKYIEYIVRGVLSNTDRVQVASTEAIPFEDLNLEEASKLNFIKNLDAIGHTWKNFSLETGSYTVNSNKIFVIKIDGNIYYKLHFTSYFNAQGQKGFPEFAFQQLI